ncbi:type IV pilus secretin PilQ [Piscirickettsia litoralis]|uniref:type IV pilus secretin PilQ n=1 Tax=Piscirickettsia litoralis TaxID=1891921 RepID=UPI002286C924|nr:type IV pilus secretin PilQ [Piscirickettsia litoralis]
MLLIAVPGCLGATNTTLLDRTTSGATVGNNGLVVDSNRLISLNFDEIDLSELLQLIAGFAHLNLVINDDVKGSISLHLQKVTWQQALDVILKAENLRKNRHGNILIIAKNNMSNNQGDNNKVGDKLESLFVNIHYGSAEKMAAILKGEAGNILSTQGSVSFDQRTNILLVQDYPDKLKEIKKIITALDKPVQQVMIEARVVIANRSFEKDLGVKFGISGGGSTVATAGSISVTNTIRQGGTPDIADRLNVSLPFSDSSAGSGLGRFALAIAKLPGNLLLDLELQALESEGEAQVVSTPKLLTANDKEAFIEQGEEIPYLESASSGAASVSFKKAVLGLTVTPHITPDQHIILNIRLSKDSRSALTAGDGGSSANALPPAIDTRVIKTQALVKDGETIVLGGIYEQEKHHIVRRVPFFC